MSSCSNCEFGKENKYYSNYSRTHVSLEENTFTCELSKKEFPRKHICNKYKKHKMLNKESFCINCDKLTLEKDWMCSECLCDIPDSEIFEDLDGNIY